MKRLTAALLLAIAGSAAAGAIAYAFNDKGAIIHNGREICVDWHGWTQHQLHGDPPGNPLSCDTP